MLKLVFFNPHDTGTIGGYDIQHLIGYFSQGGIGNLNRVDGQRHVRLVAEIPVVSGKQAFLNGNGNRFFEVADIDSV